VAHEAEDRNLSLRAGSGHGKGTLALVGPGRAGTTISLALCAQGYEAVGVAGRALDAASTQAAAACLDAEARFVAQVGVGATLVVIATPDAAIEGVAAAMAPSLEPDTLVLHLAGSRGLDVFAELRRRRPDVRVGALHPLQSFPSTTAGLDRLPGSWAAIAGDSGVETIADLLEVRPFWIADADRERYHAAAVVASNHLVALLGQVERMASAARRGLDRERIRNWPPRRIDRTGGSWRSRDGRTSPRGDGPGRARRLPGTCARSRPPRRTPRSCVATPAGRPAIARPERCGRGRPEFGVMTRLVTSISELRAACSEARARGEIVGVVPTMGSLHEGHRSLMRAARGECGVVVVTIFVNPMQFGPNEDLDRYPRDLEGDLVACSAEHVDVVFAPSVAEMYPRGPSATVVHVAGLTERLCGASRPGHFDGVTTVVAKLFSIVGPSRAYFGRKDAQQLAVVARMTADLDLPVDVVGCPIVRESDGLALSSRNAYLSLEHRAVAPTLYRALVQAAAAYDAGERDPNALVAIVRAAIGAHSEFEIDYVECVDATSLEPLESIEGPALLALAARLGPTRLIDNVHLTPTS
jgi:pantoate--beta-alanine ligase